LEFIEIFLDHEHTGCTMLFNPCKIRLYCVTNILHSEPESIRTFGGTKYGNVPAQFGHKGALYIEIESSQIIAGTR